MPFLVVIIEVVIESENHMEKQQLFRQKSIDRISSPEELNNYLRVSSPQMWLVMMAIIIMLGGILVWASVGTLETKVDGVAEAKNGEVTLIVTGSKAEKIKEGMTLLINGNTAVIDKVEIDEYGRAVASAVLNVADGKYKAEVIIESIKPISFLLR